jgi:hypothetical protein
VSAADIGSDRWLRSIRQRASHAHLVLDVSRLPTPSWRSKRARLDAIIVPASRPAQCLEPAARLATILDVPLVILCSKGATIDRVAELVLRFAGLRSVVVEIAPKWSHPDFTHRTSATRFQSASADRGGDLSAKRNIGLALARLHGWSKVVFVDDDITSLQAVDLVKLARQLENHQVAGMRVCDYPDNSVVCHGLRLAGFTQDVFVTAAVLGVRCNDLPLSFFPDIYNEDWFFFAEEAAARDLPSVGNARQAEYDPFASPKRARNEEFGDLLAEGLYALFGRQHPRMPFNKRLDKATTTYWWSFIDARIKVINEAHRALYRILDRDPHDDRASSALRSLGAAKSHLKSALNPELCVNFLNAWRDDLVDWRNFSSGLDNVGNTAQAMEFLQIKTWTGPNLIHGRRLVKGRRSGSTNLVSS